MVQTILYVTIIFFKCIEPQWVYKCVLLIRFYPTVTSELLVNDKEGHTGLDCYHFTSHWPYYDRPNFDFSKGIF